MLSPDRLRRLSVCLSQTVCNVRVPIQPVEIFGNVLRHLVPWHPLTSTEIFYGDRPRERVSK